jgi:hypothetical protein
MIWPLFSIKDRGFACCSGFWMRAVAGIKNRKQQKAVNTFERV